MKVAEKHASKEEQKAKIRRRYQGVDPSLIECIPGKPQIDFYDNDTHQRVAVYVRVSTGDPNQTSSYELQKKYYEEFVVRHPNWTLVKIYADEGISGTSLAHRKAFNQMITDCHAGLIDLIVTKSVSRFARNIMDCIGMVQMLGSLKPAVGVFFEMEAIFSLKEDSQMGLAFQATMAQEESHIKSRSMNASYEMRFSNGIFLTPKLFGYTHDEDGKLTINEEQAPTVRLMFFMYLYGYNCQQIADTLVALGRKNYHDNVKWTASVVRQVLRNERHCGDIVSRKTITPNYLDHKAVKNNGIKNQYTRRDHHDPIISRDDFIAVQRLLDNAKYGAKGILPELRVIESGVLKGFVTINPRWAGFKEDDYRMASESVYDEDEDITEDELQITAEEGDFDMRGFEVARGELFDINLRPTVSFADQKLKFNSVSVRKFPKTQYVELLIHPDEKRFAVRPASKENRNAVVWAKLDDGVLFSKDISGAAFVSTIFDIMEWNESCKYRVTGVLQEKDDEPVLVFDMTEPEVFIYPEMMAAPSDPFALMDESQHTQKYDSGKPLIVSGKRIKAIPESWARTFGCEYYSHEADSLQPEEWDAHLRGTPYPTDDPPLSVTETSELKSYITGEINSGLKKEDSHE